MLWRFISLFSELDAKLLRRLYKYSKSDQNAKFLVAFRPLDTSETATPPTEQSNSLPKLYNAWGLHRDSSCTKEKLNKMQVHAPEASLSGEQKHGGQIKRDSIKKPSHKPKLKRKRMKEALRTSESHP
ncbi:CHD1 helical C-terminal domain containing protein 1 isoform 2-T3 [Sarcophilus harrisii]